MREIPEFGHDASTLVAVGVGAVLATIGGFLATVFEARMHQRERERMAALTFGEIVASLGAMIRAAESAHGIGEPFGQLTMRILRTARREIDAYERNRASLCDVRDTDLRLSLQALMIRVALGLEGIIEAQTDDVRAGSYDYLMSIMPGIDELVRRLVPVARQSLTPYESLPFSPHGYVQPSPAAQPTSGPV